MVQAPVGKLLNRGALSDSLRGVRVAIISRHRRSHSPYKAPMTTQLATHPVNRANRVLAHTGAQYPIVQAPMGWIARTQLASAVSRAGGLGVIETSSGETENCQREISQMSALKLPFGVNLPIRFLKDDAMLKFVCASGVKFVTTSAGSPAKFIAPLKDAGALEAGDRAGADQAGRGLTRYA